MEKNENMDNYPHAKWGVGWNSLLHLRLRRLHHWSLGMDWKFHPTLLDYLSLLGLKFIHVSKKYGLITGSFPISYLQRLPVMAILHAIDFSTIGIANGVYKHYGLKRINHFYGQQLKTRKIVVLLRSWWYFVILWYNDVQDDNWRKQCRVWC